MLATLKQVWRSNRFELFAMVLAVATVVGAALYFAAQLRGNPPQPECLVPEVPEWCNSFAPLRQFYDTVQSSDLVMTALYALPLVIGGVLGAPLVARDVERRTAQFAWTIGTSRRRWFVERVVLLGTLALILMLVLAVAGQVLAAARDPDVDPFKSFSDFGARGPSVISRGMVVFALGALFGAILGRILPALLSAGAVSVAIVAFAQPIVIAAQPSAVIGPNPSLAVRHGKPLDVAAWQTPDGRVLTQDEGLAQVPANVPDPYDWLSAHYQSVSVGVAGDRYFLVEAETAFVSLILVAGASLACSLVVDRRRIS
jgi:ABC-type transport system involved in multi-copper enzyme maturation permease subunit